MDTFSNLFFSIAQKIYNAVEKYRMKTWQIIHKLSILLEGNLEVGNPPPIVKNVETTSFYWLKKCVSFTIVSYKLEMRKLLSHVLRNNKYLY